MAERDDFQLISPEDLEVPEVLARINELTTQTVRVVHFRCVGCKMPRQAGILPWSPQTAKHRCNRCGAVSEIKTRDSFEEQIEDHVGEGKDRNAVARSGRVSVSHGADFLDEIRKKNRDESDLVRAKLIEANKGL